MNTYKLPYELLGKDQRRERAGSLGEGFSEEITGKLEPKGGGELCQEKVKVRGTLQARCGVGIALWQQGEG